MEGQRLPGALNPSHFPAKLWQLVNSPRFGSVRWDARGEGLLIDQRLFERELLPLLHFHSPHFRRDRPDLLVRLKRLTSANKAKLAAGLQVPSRPPQRSRRLLGSARRCMGTRRFCPRCSARLPGPV
ncbi:heat shock factor protein 5-like [Amazona ochrocephala]